MKNESMSRAGKSNGGRFSKRIGSTTYLVSVHFSRTGRETLDDKLMRLIEGEVKKTV